MKLSVCCIVKEDTFYLDMMIKSALQFADEIIIVNDTANTDQRDNYNLCKDNDKIKYFDYPFGNHFGDGRQFAKEKASGEWILFLDADEVIHEKNAEVIKDIIADIESKKIDLVHVEYIHFINDFGHIDNSEPIHIGLYRLFKNYKEVKLNARTNHALPEYKWEKIVICPFIKIWHLGYIRGMEKVRERFERNYFYSEIHTKIHQIRWRDWHYFGEYPTKEIDIKIIPQVIKDKFMMQEGGGLV